VTQDVETPSGKGAGDENFPVGSWLLPEALRPHVAVFYAFARTIDDIADNGSLTPADKIARLDRMAGGLTGVYPDEPGLEKAHRLAASLLETRVTPRHGLDLVTAFKQDAVKLRYQDWADLIGYCNFSASPVGRYLLDLHGESTAGYPASDALCNALQVLNHLQDCQQDYRDLDRVYLPLDWMAAARARIEDLGRPSSTRGLRTVIDRCLDGVAALLVQARPLITFLGSRRLAYESAVILSIAERLTRELRRRDPLAERVVLTKPQFARCALQGIARAVVQRTFASRPTQARSTPAAKPQ
jgi:hydroxysqualene synthase